MKLLLSRLAVTAVSAALTLPQLAPAQTAPANARQLVR